MSNSVISPSFKRQPNAPIFSIACCGVFAPGIGIVPLQIHPVEDINEESLRIKEGENKPEDIERHAQEWVKNNQELFDSWIEKASAPNAELRM